MIQQDVFQERVHVLCSCILKYDSGQGFGPRPDQAMIRETMARELAGLQHIWRVRDDILTIPTDNDHIRTRMNWHIFPAGTFVKDIKSWFERTFNVAFD